jgi:hypothetical protein
VIDLQRCYYIKGDGDKYLFLQSDRQVWQEENCKIIAWNSSQALRIHLHPNTWELKWETNPNLTLYRSDFVKKDQNMIWQAESGTRDIDTMSLEEVFDRAYGCLKLNDFWTIIKRLSIYNNF